MAYQVLNKALKAPAHLQYQLAFLSTVTPPRKSQNARHLTNRDPSCRNSSKSTMDPPSAAKTNPKKTPPASASPSRATVPSASWSLNPTRKVSSGVEGRAGIIFIKSVLINGLLRSGSMGFVVFTGGSSFIFCLVFGKLTNALCLVAPNGNSKPRTSTWTNSRKPDESMTKAMSMSQTNWVCLVNVVRGRPCIVSFSFCDFFSFIHELCFIHEIC